MIPRTLEPEVMDTAEDAHEYESMDHAPVNSAFVERLVEIGAYGRMLDIGTGPGHIPLLVCERLPDVTVVGIDLSKHMLERAERNLARSHFARRIEYVHADAKALPFEDESFDTVFSNTIMHHIPDPKALLREAYRVLKKPDGVLLIRDLYRPETSERIDELVEMYAQDANDYQKELFRQSFHAALTMNETTRIVDELGIAAQVLKDTDRHLSVQIARPVRIV